MSVARPRSVRWVLVWLTLWLMSPPLLAAWYEDAQPVMGTRVHAELWHDDGVELDRAGRRVRYGRPEVYVHPVVLPLTDTAVSTSGDYGHRRSGSRRAQRGLTET